MYCPLHTHIFSLSLSLSPPLPSPPPQVLIELICNVQSMEEAVVEMKYDVKRAPLGETLSSRANLQNLHL